MNLNPIPKKIMHNLFTPMPWDIDSAYNIFIKVKHIYI